MDELFGFLIIWLVLVAGTVLIFTFGAFALQGVWPDPHDTLRVFTGAVVVWLVVLGMIISNG
jgi:hypothetical protein